MVGEIRSNEFQKRAADEFRFQTSTGLLAFSVRLLVKLHAAERSEVYTDDPFFPGSVLGPDHDASNPAAVDHLIEDRDACGQIVRCWYFAARPKLLDGVQNRYPGRIDVCIHIQP